MDSVETSSSWTEVEPHWLLDVCEDTEAPFKPSGSTCILTSTAVCHNDRTSHTSCTSARTNGREAEAMASI